MSDFDLIVIGAGPGGYVAAIRASQLGLKTALVEKGKHLGGTCLNVGCIPSKALLHATELYHEMHDKGASYGITATKLSMDVKGMMKYKDDVVNQLRKGIEFLIKNNKITLLSGTGKITNANTVSVGKKSYTTKNILIATGSTSVELPFMKFDGKTVISSDEGIAFDTAPKKLVVVGAGAIGLELGSVWARLGSDVSVVELLPQVVSTYDDDICKMAERLFKRQGIKFFLNHKVTGLKQKGKKTFLTATHKDKAIEFEADKILVAVGRKPFTEGLGLESCGIELDAHKRIPVNAHFQTKAPNIYAIGDVIHGPMLAHKAEEEGIAAVELMAGKAGHVNYEVIPNVVYTDPEIASVGLSETEAKERGIEVNTGKFPFAGNGRALAACAGDGLVKIIACKKTDKLLGVQVIGKNASELIASAVVHMEYGGSAEDIARTITAHPTLSETLKEAAMAVDKRAIHGG